MPDQAPLSSAAAGATARRRLYLLFRIAADRYALDAADVIEVLGMRTFKQVPGTPSWVAGMFDCRGTAVPAIDLSALAGAGCHMVLFSTGRGTPYGGFVPTVKIATNSELAAKKKHWIDFDAGQLIHGKAMPQLLTEFVDAIVAFASGRQTCNEKNDFRELAIFKSGVTL